ncbi:MAG: hypothetical protein O7F76_04435, partial [Planctomycetota bacterium]|nr:hypothetical protein [Planctomycetota bacterium]
MIVPGVPFEEPPPRPAPLLPLALGLTGGIILDRFFPFDTWLSISLLAAGAIVFGKLHKRRAAATAALILAAAGLGSLRHAVHDRWLPANHISHFTADEPVLADVRGRLASRP